MFWRPLLFLFLISTIAQASEDSQAIAHGDSNGYDYYDRSWSFIGSARSNLRGSYDFFDRQGHMVGYASATTGSRVDFYFANGELFRTTLLDAAGGVISLDSQGNVKTIGMANTSGGMDVFVPFTMQVANSSTSLGYEEFGEKLPGEE